MEFLIVLLVIVYLAYLIFKIKTYFTIYSNSKKLNKILDMLHSKKYIKTENLKEKERAAKTVFDTPPPVSQYQEVKPAQKPASVPKPAQAEVKRPSVLTTSTSIKPEIKPMAVDVKPKIKIIPPVDLSAFKTTLPKKSKIDSMQSEVEDKVAGILSKIWNWIVVGEEFRNPKLSLEYAVASTWLLRVAILFIVVGIGFLLKYSIENSIIGPAERLGLSVITGIVMLVSGIKLLKGKYRVIGQGLLGGSIAVFYFSAFASSMMYHLIPTEYAFVAMILITILSGVLAVTLDSLLVAVLGAIGGYLTPLMLNTGFDNKVVLLSYTLLLGIGVLSIARYKRWKLLNALSFFFTYLIFFVSAAKVYDKNIHFKITLTFATLYFLMFSGITVVYNLVNKEKSTILELFGMISNAAIYSLTAYFLIIDLYPREYTAYVSIALAVFYAAGMISISSRKIEDKALEIFLTGFASFFVTITIPILLSDEWMTSAWAIQALIFLWISLKIKSKFLRGISYVVYFITFSKVLSVDLSENFISVHSANYTSELISRLLTFGSLIISTALGYRLLRKENNYERDAQSSFFIWVTSVFAFVYLHFEVYYFCGEYYKPLTEPLMTLIWVGAILLILRKFSTGRSVFKVLLSLLSIGILIKLFFFDSFLPLSFVYGGSYNTERFLIRLLNYALVNFAILAAYFVTAKNKNSAKAIFAVSSLGLLFLYATFELNTFLHNFLSGFQSGGISILWALFAIAFVFSGIKANLRSMRFTGLILFTICALKVFFSDLSQLSSLYKIYASIALGIVILAGAFIYVRFVEKFSTEEKGKDTNRAQ